ncbi:MAG TPA: hypothetical protein PLK94_04620 [Alphaproteobacteria bacterium]|nr:hypothetical protein [Alphaproteobacteria bacterium]
MDAIKLFNKKYEKLENSRFIKFIENYGFSPKLNVPEQKYIDGSKIPDDDSIDAFVLTIRFFIQNNESCSIYNLSKIYNSQTNISEENLNRFTELRKLLNDNLDTPLWFTINKSKLTYRQILEGMIYSELSHSNEKGHQEFSSIFKKTFLVKAMMKHEFIRVLMFMYGVISEIHELNEEVFS